jgi:hypothetical protein
MPANNPFPNNAVNIDEPAGHAAAITPSDTADLANATRFIRITVAGTLHVTMVGGEDVTYLSGSLALGVAHRLRVTRVFATGTTATGIFGEW